MKKLFVMGNIILVIALSGCGAHKNQSFLEEMSDTEITRSLVKNVTTKEQVKYDFGDPEEIKFDKSSEKWVYSFKRSDEKGVNFVASVNSFYQSSSDTIKCLKIFFNSRGIVERYTLSSSHGASKFWFNDMSSQKNFQIRNHGFFSEESTQGINSPNSFSSNY